MEEKLSETLKTVGGVMHFFGVYVKCNMFVKMAALLEKHGIESLDQLEQTLKGDTNGQSSS